MRNELPAYEKGHHEIYQRIETKDLAAATADLSSVTESAKPLFDAVGRAIEIRQTRAEERFHASNTSYHAAPTLTFCVSAIALVVGIVLSIVIARSVALPFGQAVEVLQKVADGDLTVKLDVNTREEVGRMANTLNRAVEKLNTALRALPESAGNSDSASQELAAASEQLATSAQQQAASLEETSASLEEINASARQTAENAKHASQLASRSTESAESGQQVVAGGAPVEG